MKQVYISILIFSGLLVSFSAEGSNSGLIDLEPERRIFDLTVSDGIVEGSLEIPSLELDLQKLDSIDYLRLLLKGFHKQGNPGSPELPGISRLFEKGSPGSYQISIIEMDSVVIDLNVDYPGMKLYPFQPSSRKSEADRSVMHLSNRFTRSADQWISLPVIRIDEEGVLRGVRMGLLTISPVKYHPGRHQLKVYTKISFRCEPSLPGDMIRPDIESPPFRSVFSDVAMDQKAISEEKVISSSPMTMVILSDSTFHNSLKPLAEWKRSKGFHVIEAYTGDPAVGEDATSISAYLENLYHDPPGDTMKPTYLLIVGDVEYVPPSSASFPITDLYYTTMDGPGDYLPDMFCGRLPAKNVNDLHAMIEKILRYEKLLFHDPSFLEKTILIAGNDWHGYTEGNGQLNYGTTYYFNESNGIDASAYLHPGASSLDVEIRQEFNDGAGFVNYTGHGTYTGWVDPAFRISHINALNNTDKYPLVIGNGCETNVFNMQTDCFAEAIVKAPKKGALAYVGCTADSYWEEDFYWAVGVGEISSDPEFSESDPGLYDRIFHLNGEPPDTWASSIGEMIFAGNMAVQGSNSAYKEYYWRIYQLMGDPSIIPWFGIPESPEVDFPSSLSQGASSVSIQAEPYDYAAISSGGTLLDAKHSDEEGIADLFIPEAYRGDTLLLVVTGDRRTPFIRQIPDPGYFELLTLTLSEESIEDGKLSHGESASLFLQVKNLSEIVTSPDSLVIRHTGDDIIFMDSVIYLPPVNPGDTLTLSNVFPFEVNDLVNDQEAIVLSLARMKDITGNLLMDTLKLHAPLLRLVSLASGDHLTGNGNGILEAGETVRMDIRVDNQGSMTSDSIVFSLPEDTDFFPDNLILKTGPLSAGADTTFFADLLIPSEYASLGAVSVPVYSGDGIYHMDTASLVIGKPFEDFASRNLDRLPWSLVEWQLDTLEFFNAPAALRSPELGNYESASVSIFVHVFQPDSISFMMKVSSESEYDFLKVYVEGVEWGRWSGETGWTHVKIDLPEGLHEITWSYEKDQSKAEGMDAAWIDQLVFPEQAFVKHDLAAEEVIFTGSPPFGTAEDFSLRVRNYGTDTVSGPQLHFRLDQADWQFRQMDTKIPPGTESILLVEKGLDMIDVGMYQLTAFASGFDDNYPANDTLSAEIDHYAFPDLAITLLGTDSSANDHVDILVRYENVGNILVPEVDYTVIIDETFSFTGRNVLNLERGEAAEKRIVLINAFQDWISPGWHNFRLEIGTDSLSSNNTVEGTVFWNPTAVPLTGLSQISFAPNPAGSEIVLSTIGNYLPGRRVIIRDISGRVLISEEITAERQIVQLENKLPSAGMYLLEVRSGEDRIPAGKLIYQPEK